MEPHLKILYITTFNKELYEASGKRLVKSFLKTKQDADMLICYENLNMDKHFQKLADQNFRFYNLAESKFLHSWLKENEDVIPPDYGGKAVKYEGSRAYLKWNLRSAGWFRKIATFHYALNFAEEYDVIVFIDSDAQFEKTIPKSVMSQALGKSDYFYHWGDGRKAKELGVESGFIGFKTSKNGLMVLNYWIDKYKDKAFEKYIRWDDGGMFGQVLKELDFKYGNDLVTDYKLPINQSHVLCRGIFANYISHDKGLHKRLGLTGNE